MKGHPAAARPIRFCGGTGLRGGRVARRAVEQLA
jgi:hypothetical protein